MKKLISILFILAMPVFVFAQDGSAGSAPDTQARATTSEQTAPSAGATDPRPQPTTPTAPQSGGQAAPTAAPIAIPAPIPPPNIAPPPSAPETEHQESDSNILEILAIGAATLLGGLGIYKLMTKSSVEKNSDDKKNNNRCFNIKKMMEDKLKELTDLKGQLESKAKGMAREKFKEAIAGTETAKILDTVERAEKEYNRLKKLFEQCELELDAEKIKLVAAALADIPTLISIEKSISGNKVYSPMLEEDEWKEEFKKGAEVFLIKKGEATVGNATYEKKQDGTIYLSGLAIDKSFQKQGIGKEVMKQVLERFKDAKRIELAVHPDNGPAIKLYKSYGFKEESRKEDYFGDGEPRLIFSLSK